MLLASFCLRLACGMLVALLLLRPAQINPRFYRVQFLSVLGLTVLAAAVAWDGASMPLLTALGAASLGAFAGSFAWSLEGAPGGRTLIGLTMVALAMSLWYFHASTVGPDDPAWLLLNDASSSLLL